MPPEVISYLYFSGNQSKRFKFQIILQCAPFLKGLKCACMVSLAQDAGRALAGIFMGTDVEYRILAKRKGRELVLLYRESRLKRHLAKEEMRVFLADYGYESRNLEEVFSRLSARICEFIRGDMGFPHEIGIFLDYPIEDVRGFIREKGKNSLLNGYWKVYHNPGKAQMTFYAYDKARVSAVNEFLVGKQIRDIVCDF